MKSYIYFYEFIIIIYIPNFKNIQKYVEFQIRYENHYFKTCRYVFKPAIKAFVFNHFHIFHCGPG